MKRPAYVTLRLTVPRMESDLIRTVQGRLAGVEQDGLYGCQTARAVQSWQWRTGAPWATGALAPQEMLVLLGQRMRPRDWKARTKERLVRPGRFRPIPAPLKCEEPTPGQMVGGVKIIPRALWGARPPRDRSAASHFRGVPHVVHWIGPGNGATSLEGSMAQARSFQRYHMDEKGWADIAYNWLLPGGASPGIVLEGRGDNVRGAHSGNDVANGYPGVCILTGEDDRGPTAVQLATLQALREAKGWGRRYGHREFFATSCPGPVLWPFVLANR